MCSAEVCAGEECRPQSLLRLYEENGCMMRHRAYYALPRFESLSGLRGEVSLVRQEEFRQSLNSLKSRMRACKLSVRTYNTPPRSMRLRELPERNSVGFECEFAGTRDCQSNTMLSQSDRSLFKSLETYNRCECLLDWIRKLSNNKVLTILS